MSAQHNAEKRAAEASKEAEEERIARLKIEARMAARRVTGEQKKTTGRRPPSDWQARNRSNIEFWLSRGRRFRRRYCERTTRLWVQRLANERSSVDFPSAPAVQHFFWHKPET